MDPASVEFLLFRAISPRVVTFYIEIERVIYIYTEGTGNSAFRIDLLERKS